MSVTVSRHRAGVTLLAATWMAGCQCADTDIVEISSSEGSVSTSGETSTGSSTEGSTTNPAEDASRFFGVFHYEHAYFDAHVWSDQKIPPRWPPLVNVEIRPDGTAGMLLQPCVAIFVDGFEVEWQWELAQDGWLELRPGPGEDSLRFIEPTELASLRATMDDPCTMQLEADGELLPYVFRPGRACWVNRCDPPWNIHVSYCEGEEPPTCP